MIWFQSERSPMRRSTQPNTDSLYRSMSDLPSGQHGDLSVSRQVAGIDPSRTGTKNVDIVKAWGIMLDVVIIGAGTAGLAAARRIKDKGASFRLLEAKAQIGGRVVPDRVTLGAPFDLGGHWLHSPTLNPLTPLVDRYLFHVKQGAEDFRVARGGAILAGAEHEACFAYVEDCFAKIAAVGDGDLDCPVSELFPFRGKWHDFFEANFIAKQGMPLDQS